MGSIEAVVVALPAALLLALVVGSVARRRRARAVPSRPRSTRPADGVVEYIEVPAFARDSNGIRPDIGPFRSVEREVPPVALPARRTAPPLLGEVVLWQLFIGRDGKRWNDEEIALAHEATERASVWLEREAMKRGAAVNIRIPTTYFTGVDDVDDEVEVGFQYNGEEVGPREGNAEVKAIASAGRVAASLGFPSLVELVEQARGAVDADEQAWLVHVRRKGQSFAVPPDDSPIPGLTLACCYLREASFSEPIRKSNLAADPVTVAHELLHLFGATDKYGMPLTSFPKGSLTGRDIMRLSVERLSSLRVDDGTAVEIGWPLVPRDSNEKRLPRSPER